jgi:uncharacterized protein (DUF2164 family)
MAITLSPETTKRLHESIKRYFDEQFEAEIGDLKTTMLLDFVLKEIAPTIYNRAIADAQKYFEARLVDLEGVCYEKEFAYWAPKAGGRSEPKK